MAAINFPSSSASPWTAPNGTIYIWVTAGSSGYWEASSPTDEYLKLDASNGPITGSLTFNSNITVDGIISGNVTGNVTGDVAGNVTGNLTGDVTGNATTATSATTATTATTATNVTITAASDSSQNFRIPFAASSTGDTIASAPLKLCNTIKANPGSGKLFATTFQGDLISTTITNTNGDVQLNTGNGDSGITFIGRNGLGSTGDLLPTGNNSMLVGNVSEGSPGAVFGREGVQNGLYGSTWINMMYGGASDSALLTLTANGGNSSSWKNHITFTQYDTSSSVFKTCGSFRSRVNDGGGLKLFLNNAANGFEVTGRSTAGGNRATVMTFNKRTADDEDPAGIIQTGGEGSGAYIQISSTNGSAPVSATLTDTRNVTSATALPDPTTAIKALTPQLLTLASGVTVASFPATHTRTHVSAMVYGADNAVDDLGAAEFAGVDHANLVPYLTKALQVLIARVEALEA